jgi:hypothetical protein
MILETDKKYRKLALSIFFDAVGYASFLIPGLGELVDIAWAPASAFIMTKMYRGNIGKIAAGVSFIEEALPGVDIIPTFTLMWLFTYVFKSKETIIEVNNS